MWATAEVVLLLRASHRAMLLASERSSGPRLGHEAMLERWEEVLQDFCDAPENDAVMLRFKECVRELIEIV